MWLQDHVKTIISSLPSFSSILSLERFCNSEFQDCPESCLSFFQDVSRTCTWKNVRLYILSFMFPNVLKGCNVSMLTEVNKRA